MLTNRDQLRILYLNEVSWIGGAEGALFDLVTNLDSTKVTSLVICPGEGEFVSVLRKSNVPVALVPVYGLRARNPLRFFETYWRLLSVASRFGPDIVHVNQQFFCGFGVFLKRVLRVPVVVHLRGVETDAFFDRFLISLLRADSIVCVSNAVRERLLQYAQENRLGVLEELGKKAVVIHDGLRPVQHSGTKQEFCTCFGIPHDRKLVGIVGQVTRAKGLLEFADAARYVLAAVPDVHFVVVGECTDPSDSFVKVLHARIEDAGLTSSFTFTGFLKNSAGVLFHLDVSVLASHQDAFPRVVLESLAAGVPCVATSVGGVPEMIDDEVNGFLVPRCNSAALADAVVRALCLPDQARQRISEVARESVQHFSIDGQVEAISSLYHSLKCAHS